MPGVAIGGASNPFGGLPDSAEGFFGQRAGEAGVHAHVASAPIGRAGVEFHAGVFDEVALDDFLWRHRFGVGVQRGGLGGVTGSCSAR